MSKFEQLSLKGQNLDEWLCECKHGDMINVLKVKGATVLQNRRRQEVYIVSNPSGKIVAGILESIDQDRLTMTVGFPK